jgi:hypothetical protein
MLTQEVKNLYVVRAVQHQLNDEIVQGQYWDGKKGCCVGCLAHTNDSPHKALAQATGVPEWLYQVADVIHEGLPPSKMKQWPRLFISAMPVGLTTEKFNTAVKAHFSIMLLNKVLDTFDHARFPDVHAVVERVIALWQRDDIMSGDWKREATEAAATAQAVESEWSVWAARAVALGVALEARAIRAATWAARAALRAAQDEERYPEFALRAVVWAARAATEAGGGTADLAEATWIATYEYIADQLLAIMQEVTQ